MFRAQAEYFLAHGGKTHTLVTARFLTLFVYRWVEQRRNHSPRSHRFRRYHDLQFPNNPDKYHLTHWHGIVVLLFRQLLRLVSVTDGCMDQGFF